MNDLTFGTTLFACFVATVATVWMEASQRNEPTDVAAAVVRRDRSTARVAGEQDKDCTKIAAAPTRAR